MQVIPRQKDNLASPDHDTLFLTVDPDMKVTFDDVVKHYEVGRRSEKRRTMLRRNARRYAPRREKLGVQKHAAGQMRHPQDIG
jgi:hypothetical protein